MRQAARLLAALALLSFVASCGGILPPPPPPPQLYRLTPLPAGAAAGAPLALQLAVDTPTAPAAFDTTRIALARSPTTLDYFANAAWTDRPGPALQMLMVESLENSGRIRVVTEQSPQLRADAVLMTDLSDFEAVYSGDGPPKFTSAWIAASSNCPNAASLRCKASPPRCRPRRTKPRRLSPASTIRFTRSCGRWYRGRRKASRRRRGRAARPCQRRFRTA